jgi:hypothetical protein
VKNSQFDRQNIDDDTDFEEEDFDAEDDFEDEEPPLLPVSPETYAIVKRDFAHEPDEVKDALAQLIEAVKRRARTEALSAGTNTKEAYLAALDKTRQMMAEKNIEVPKLDRVKLDRAIDAIEIEARKNWKSVLREARSLSSKVSAAARSAWENWQHHR